MRIRQFISALALTLAASAVAGCGGSDSSPSSTARTASPVPSTPAGASASGGSPAASGSGACGATASISIPTPSGSGYTEVVAGSLACGTGSPEGAKMHAVWHERSGDKTCDAQADATGIAACNRQIGNLTKGFKVVIDVTFTLNGQTYSASTSFTPQ